MASPAQSALARSPVLWELTSPKLRESPVRAAVGPSLRPSQGTWHGVTERTQLVAPSMSFPPPYAENQAQATFIRLPKRNTFDGYGDFPQHIATCKYCGAFLPWQLLSGTHAHYVLPPFDCAGDTWERVDDVSVLAPWQLGGGGGQAAAGREVWSALWGAEGWGAGSRKRNGALCYSPSYFHHRLNQRLSWYRTLKFSVLKSFWDYRTVYNGLLTCNN